MNRPERTSGAYHGTNPSETVLFVQKFEWKATFSFGLADNWIRREHASTVFRLSRQFFLEMRPH